jgi:hypothetical protein
MPPVAMMPHFRVKGAILRGVVSWFELETRVGIGQLKRPQDLDELTE